MYLENVHVVLYCPVKKRKEKERSSFEPSCVLIPSAVKLVLCVVQAVQAVNVSHDSCHAQMDVKFRSLICCGLK